MHRRASALLLAVVTGGVCAGLIWGSQQQGDLLGWPRLAGGSVETRAAPDAGARFDGRVDEQSAIAETLRREFVGGRSGGGIHRLLAARSHAAANVAAVRSPVDPQQPYVMSAPYYMTDPATGHASAIAVGDISGDGRDDIAFLSLRSEPNMDNSAMEIYAIYQRDDGTLEPAVKIGESGTNLAYQLLIADFDNDGVDDIITVTLDGIMVMRSNRDGTFTTSSRAVTTPMDVYDIVTTDVDRDGFIDVLADTSDTAATVVHGNAQGIIDRITTLPLPSAAVRTTGDVTGDGLDDLILGTIVNSPLEEFRIYPALASGGYAAPVKMSLPLGSNMTSSFAVGDFNSDGRGDLAVDEGRNLAPLRLYFQDAQGRLGPGIELARREGASTTSMIAADLNRDGRMDLAIAHSGWDYIGYYLQSDTGLRPETVINAKQYLGRLYYFVSGDLNSDGIGDLVISRLSLPPVLLYGQGFAVPSLQRRTGGNAPAQRM